MDVLFLEAGMDALPGEKIATIAVETKINAWKVMVETLLLLERDVSVDYRNKRGQLWRE